MASPTDMEAWRRRAMAASEHTHRIWGRVTKEHLAMTRGNYNRLQSKRALAMLARVVTEGIADLLSGPAPAHALNFTLHADHPMIRQNTGDRRGLIRAHASPHGKDPAELSVDEATRWWGDTHSRYTLLSGTLKVVPNLLPTRPASTFKFTRDMRRHVYTFLPPPRWIVAFPVHQSRYAVQDPFHAWFARDRRAVLNALFEIDAETKEIRAREPLPLDMCRLIVAQVRDAEFYRRARGWDAYAARLKNMV